MPKYAALWFVTSLMLVGCASGPVKQPDVVHKSQPSWVTKPPLKSGVAYGVGAMEIYGNPAEAVQRAAELARVDLVTQLKVTVSSDMTSSISETSGSNQPTQLLRSVHQQVRSSIPQAELDEVETTDTYVDAKHAYALVELDRAVAAARLRRDIQELDEELIGYAVLNPQGSTLERLQPLLPALTVIAKRDQLSERLALVSMERKGEPLATELKALQQRIDTLLKQLVVTLELNDSGAEAIAGDVLEALTKQGLRVSSSGPADLRFVLNCELTHKQQSGSHYVFANSRVRIENSNGQVLSSFSKQAKGVSGIDNVARQKAGQQVAQLLSDELAVTLVQRLR